MLSLSRILTVFFTILIVLGCSTEVPVTSSDVPEDELATLAKSGNVEVSVVDVVVFQPAGDVGGGVLEPGTFFPPTNGGVSKLYRGRDRLGYTIRTTGLPPGAYTNWWVIFNNPDGCEGDCGEDDLANPDANASVFWATGGIVSGNGVGKFKATIREGQPSKGPDGFILGNGLEDASKAEAHLIIKYHGPASHDPDVLYAQTHTLVGACESGANAFDLGPPFGVQCFDPQVAVHRR